ncbi:MAG: DEAD/DEAH box helicase family protein [Actinomycetota bacterium]|nr:DEAD/DEAH box helicase family protein [Actinomycetota bacterium]
MSHDEERPPVDLSTELEELRADNARLRDLLGLNTRPSDGHRQAWAPTLFTRPTDASAIDSTATMEDKLALFRSLFGARSDVFALRWENTSRGKSGWSPAVRGGWADKRSKKEYLPLTDTVLTNHLDGDVTVGIYPLLRDDTCTLLACDFDGGTWALDSLAYLDACHQVEVPAVLERSRSGNGAHVWVFFDGPVPATAARSLGTSLLRRAMTERAELDLSSYDRFFPSQDFMPKGSFGNLIALPLHGERLPSGATAFLDPTTMEPWPDQWAFLSSVARLAPDAAVALADSLRPVDAGPTLTLADLAKADGPAPPPVIRARLGATLSIERSGLPPALFAGLKHLASIHNPVFYEKQRMRFSTWDTPRFIRCYEEDLEWIHIPRGLTERVTELIASVGSRLDMTDVRPQHEEIGFEFAGGLRPHQRTAVDASAPHDLGVIVAPPGTGKTVMACSVIAHHDLPTLVLVDRKPLLDQWCDRLQEHLGLDPDQIGVIGGGKNKPTGVVDVAMIQSVARREQPAELFERYGLVVVDECHHLPAVSFEACVRHATSRRWLGLTATPYRSDGLEGIIAFQCGPTRHEITTKEVTTASFIRRELIVHETRCSVAEEDAASIQAVFSAIVDAQQRTDQICADVHDAMAAGRTCLVLTQRTAHIDAIVDGLAQLGDKALILRGGLGKKARAAVADAIESRQESSGIVVVATGSYIGEGFDWPELDTLFLAFPIAFKGRVVQYVGRLLRTHADKHHVELHDYVDVRIPVLDRMHRKRLPAYASLGFDIPKGRRQRRKPSETPTRKKDPTDAL